MLGRTRKPLPLECPGRPEIDKPTKTETALGGGGGWSRWKAEMASPINPHRRRSNSGTRQADGDGESEGARTHLPCWRARARPGGAAAAPPAANSRSAHTAAAIAGATLVAGLGHAGVAVRPHRRSHRPEARPAEASRDGGPAPAPAVTLQRIHLPAAIRTVGTRLTAWSGSLWCMCLASCLDLEAVQRGT